MIVPRFDPDKDSMRWKGHLSRYELHAEFLNPCTETLDGSGAGDLDCDGKCQSVFLTDSTGAFISEDSDGIFRRNEPNAPYCIQAPLCAARGKTCGMPGTVPASSWWDAATAMTGLTTENPRAWDDRVVYSVVDDAAGLAGRQDRRGGHGLPAPGHRPGRREDRALPRRHAPRSAATWPTSSPPRGTATRPRRCRTSTSFCVKEVIRFLLGADVFNEQVLPADLWRKPATDDGQDPLPDRAFLLGDIFHSSPVVMDPPPPAYGILCPNGLHNQCLTSLWQTPVQSTTATTDGHLNAYQAYAESSTYKDRRKVVLVGANDGFLHAFDGGTWHGNPTPATRSNAGRR